MNNIPGCAKDFYITKLFEKLHFSNSFIEIRSGLIRRFVGKNDVALRFLHMEGIELLKDPLSNCFRCPISHRSLLPNVFSHHIRGGMEGANQTEGVR